MDIPSTDRSVLTKRQFFVDPLTLIFNTITNIPATKDECWNSRSDSINLLKYRRELFYNLVGPSQRRYRIVTTCRNKKCINPWHCARERARTDMTPKELRYHHPEVHDREALLQWYSAGNSPIRALDVSHVQEILQASGTNLRPNKGRPKIPR